MPWTADLTRMWADGKQVYACSTPYQWTADGGIAPGYAALALPSLLNMEYLDACALLTANGLNVDVPVIARTMFRRQPGRVIGQVPAAGITVQPYQRIQLIVVASPFLPSPAFDQQV